MKGTEKQITWAKKIQKQAIDTIDTYELIYRDQVEEEDWPVVQASLDIVRGKILSIDSAAELIEIGKRDIDDYIDAELVKTPAFQAEE